MTMARELSPDETLIRAVALGIAAMVIVPLVVYSVAYQVLLALGACDIPFWCSSDANDIAMLSAPVGFLAGVGLSVLLDRRRRPRSD